tara:strand:- start:1092 stop:2210 length:1119 start_codon:yes stop_codon:yes gene_type:complete
MDNMEFLDLKTQQARIKDSLKKRFDNILNHGAYIMGPEIDELEEKLADYCEVKHAISCSSGTDALLIPLMAWGVGPNDAVFTTPFTYHATAEVIAILGATPVLVDVYESTFNIDCEKLEIEISRIISEGKLKPKAIIPVDLFGLPARYRKINDIAKKYNLKVIEDAAQSFGGSIRGEKVGTFGDIAATSFYPAKPLGCYGDGGAIFTNNDDLAEQCKAIRFHGTKAVDRYHSEMIGLNGRLDSIQAAVLLEKLIIFDEELDLRENISLQYRKNIHNCQYIPENYTSSNALFSFLLDSSQLRNKTILKLKEKQIPTMIYYKYPIHLMKAFSYLRYVEGDFPVSESLSKRILSLPMHPYLSKNDLKLIIATLGE